MQTTATQSLSASTRVLLSALEDASFCARLTEDEWDKLVRSARSARLLGVLADDVQRHGLMSCIPRAAADHLRAALNESRFLLQMTRRQLAAVEMILRPVGATLVALKGAAYVLRDCACTAGRMPRDVDIMVERHHLHEVETALLGAGWTFETTDPYDQHYYRAWSHELPPMQAPGMPFELDVHHTIVPPLGRLRPSAPELFSAAVPVAGSGWSTLCPADLVLHVAVHLYQDTEWAGRLRDLVDFDRLIRESAAADPGFWPTLEQRAQLLGLAEPLWYMLTLASQWLKTPLGLSGDSLASMAPAARMRRWVLTLSRRCFEVADPDAEPRWPERTACVVMGLRAAWDRMPAHLLAYHAAHKLLRSARRRSSDASEN